MIKKTINYTTYDGLAVSEDFYFNLTKAELIELEVSEKEGFAETLQKLVSESEGRAVVEMFKRIILLSIGKKSEDGKRFVKNDEIRDAFAESPAYSELFMELATDTDASSAFIKGLLPADLSVETETVQLPEPAIVKDISELSREELVAKLQENKQ